MPKRAPSPVKESLGTRFLTVAYPYPMHANLELIADCKEFAFWIACIVGKDMLRTLFNRPRSPNMVVIEVSDTCPNFNNLLGEHHWCQFLRNPTDEEKDRSSQIFWCTHSHIRDVEKSGWKRIDVQEVWFNTVKWRPDNCIINYPYPPTTRCDVPQIDKMAVRFCRPLPQDIIFANDPPGPRVVASSKGKGKSAKTKAAKEGPVVGSPGWVQAKQGESLSTTIITAKVVEIKTNVLDDWGPPLRVPTTPASRSPAPATSGRVPSIISPPPASIFGSTVPHSATWVAPPPSVSTVPSVSGASSMGLPGIVRPLGRPSSNSNAIRSASAWAAGSPRSSSVAPSLSTNNAGGPPVIVHPSSTASRPPSTSSSRPPSSPPGIVHPLGRPSSTSRPPSTLMPPPGFGRAIPSPVTGSNNTMGPPGSDRANGDTDTTNTNADVSDSASSSTFASARSGHSVAVCSPAPTYGASSPYSPNVADLMAGIVLTQGPSFVHAPPESWDDEDVDSDDYSVPTDAELQRPAQDTNQHPVMWDQTEPDEMWDEEYVGHALEPDTAVVGEQTDAEDGENVGENLWPEFGKEEPPLPAGTLKCRAHGKLCKKGICVEYTAQLRREEREREQKERNAARKGRKGGRNDKKKPLNATPIPPKPAHLLNGGAVRPSGSTLGAQHDAPPHVGTGPPSKTSGWGSDLTIGPYGKIDPPNTTPIRPKPAHLSSGSNGDVKPPAVAKAPSEAESGWGSHYDIGPYGRTDPDDSKTPPTRQISVPSDARSEVESIVSGWGTEPDGAWARDVYKTQNNNNRQPATDTDFRNKGKKQEMPQEREQATASASNNVMTTARAHVHARKDVESDTRSEASGWRSIGSNPWEIKKSWDEQVAEEFDE